MATLRRPRVACGDLDRVQATYSFPTSPFAERFAYTAQIGGFSLKSKKQVLTIQEVAALTGFSPQTITRIFQDKPGVIILKRPEKMHKRGYRSIRIPHTVYEHVIGELSV
jgi:hypothetical protein